ncbi:hypothetical protein [Streptomyces apocyni]|uniref:hypothetical protein n=1 Tax=Streptomyces apocyni TaxID=2654677 RepID=UPI0012EAD145|nr:hypothetical protein [Streptomyces apocyni]
MAEVIAVLAVLFVLFVALGVFVTVKVVKAAKRGVDRTLTQARRSVEDSTLRAKSFTQVGAAGELAQLRLRLRTSMRATQDSLGAAVKEDPTLRESLGLFERLSQHGHELDDELRRLEREPDKTRLGERLPELRARTKRITEAADSLRWAAHDRARRFADDDLEVLGQQIEVESGALRHWTTEPGDDPSVSAPAAPSAPSASSAPSAPPAGAGSEGARPPGARPPGAGARAAAWPEPPRADSADGATSAEQTWPEPRSAEEAQGPQAIEPTRPVTSYPWQKAHRPESTN